MTMPWKTLMLWALGLALTQGRILEDTMRTDLIKLLPFTVRVATSGDVEDINIYALTDIVTDWLSDSFEERSNGIVGDSISFHSISLEHSVARRRLEEDNDGQLSVYTVFYEGWSLWNRQGLGTEPVDPEVVEFLQRATFVDYRDLLALLQEADPFTGLGEDVKDIRVGVTQTVAPDDNNDNLEIIIIIAIVVACLAFALLMFAVVWAWKTDQSKREIYKVGSSHVGDPDMQQREARTGSESDFEKPAPAPTGQSPVSRDRPLPEQQKEVKAPARPPAEIEQSPGDYPDSVISEDISTSLTAYYRSGMASYTNPLGPRQGNTTPRELNDAASMSSMDSYGYSLDGYAPSLGPAPQMGYPVGSLNGSIKDSDADDKDDETAEDQA